MDSKEDQGKECSILARSNWDKKDTKMNRETLKKIERHRRIENREETARKGRHKR